MQHAWQPAIYRKVTRRSADGRTARVLDSEVGVFISRIHHCVIGPVTFRNDELIDMDN
mgnify:CR=1 FL=1